jgi:uncharacterized repeat protein (TIGR01451 family)
MGGACTIQATQGGNAVYGAAAMTQTFTVTPASQTIAFGALSSEVLSAAPVTVSATTSSGLPVSFASITPGVCAISDAAVTLISVGTCTIQATQAGNANYAIAPAVNQSFQVTKGLDTDALLVGSTAGTSSVVLSYPGAWTATANDSFLHISSGSSSGTNNAVVIFSYDAFTSTGTRAGTLTVAGLTLTVTQAGTNYVGPGPVITLVSSGVSAPKGVAVDSVGNVYIADVGKNAIEEWNASTQQVSTLVSTGMNGPEGVAVDASGNVYIADTGNSAIEEWNASTQQVTTLVSTGLTGPKGVAVDASGNVYIADTGNNAIEEWNASTQQVSTLVSTGMNGPEGVAADASGNVYIADTGNNAVKEWTASTQQVITLVSTGLNGPEAAAVDDSGNVYVADTGDDAIKEWSAATQQVTTLVSAASTGLDGVAVDGFGNVYFSDSTANAVEEMPFVFAGPANLTESSAAGSDSLLPVLPSTASLAGIFAPVSDQGWLTIGAVTNGAVGFSFTANTSNSARTAHIVVLGQQISVSQSAPPVPILTVTKTHEGNFVQGQNSTTYTVTVSNAAGAVPSSGLVTVTDTMPAGLTLVSMAGTGWSCSGDTCTRSDVLNPGWSYPSITVTVNSAANAPSQVTNQVRVSGGGSASATAGDLTSIAVFTCAISGDGTTSIVDVQTIINEALGDMPAVHDLNHDGVVNVADVQKVLNSALGLGCSYY